MNMGAWRDGLGTQYKSAKYKIQTLLGYCKLYIYGGGRSAVGWIRQSITVYKHKELALLH